jgi:hypothetical protein
MFVMQLHEVFETTLFKDTEVEKPNQYWKYMGHFLLQ